MHTEDAQDMVTAAVAAGFMTKQQGDEFMATYRGLREPREKAAEERAKHFTREDSWFEKYVFGNMFRPVLGVPLFFIVLVVWIVLSEVVFK